MNQLNTSLRTVFQDLVERRLWPVALALVVALIAIPVLLSNSSSETASTTTPVPPVTPATGAAGSLTAFQPVVNSEGSKSSEIEKNLSGFDSKDPFKVQGLPTSSGQTADAGAAAGGTTTTGTDTTGTGSGTAGTGSQGTSGSGDSTGQTVKFYDWTVTVRFGIGDNLDKKRMMRFRALPNSENPVVVFMDVTTNGESAVFMVSTATGTTGDGDCEPDDTCTFVYMKPGQTQKFEAVDAEDKVVTYTLKLTDIKLEEIEPPADAASKSGRASTRAERLARRAARIERDRRDAGFAARLEAVGF